MRLFFKVLVTLAFLASSLVPAGCSAPLSTVPPGVNKAAIVDQLYLRQPNPQFIAEATRILESYGLAVDLYQGTAVNVDFYRQLPALGYKLVVLRVHSGLLLSMEGDQIIELDTTYLFTAENYSSSKYVSDQLADRVSNALMEEDTPLVFAVNSEFMARADGDFNKTVILAMGCESYTHDDLPLAFIGKGASAFIGWSDTVSLDYVDRSTLELLKNLCTEDMTISGGVAATMEKMGTDPYFDSYLKYYPAANENSTIAELIGK